MVAADLIDELGTDVVQRLGQYWPNAIRLERDPRTCAAIVRHSGGEAEFTLISDVMTAHPLVSAELPAALGRCANSNIVAEALYAVLQAPLEPSVFRDCVTRIVQYNPQRPFIALHALAGAAKYARDADTLLWTVQEFDRLFASEVRRGRFVPSDQGYSLRAALSVILLNACRNPAANRAIFEWAAKWYSVSPSVTNQQEQIRTILLASALRTQDPKLFEEGMQLRMT